MKQELFVPVTAVLARRHEVFKHVLGNATKDVREVLWILRVLLYILYNAEKDNMGISSSNKRKEATERSARPSENQTLSHSLIPLLPLRKAGHLTQQIILPLRLTHNKSRQLPTIESPHSSFRTHGHELRLAVLRLVGLLRRGRTGFGIGQEIVADVRGGDGEGVVEVEDAATVDAGDVTNGVDAGAGVIDAEGLGVGFDEIRGGFEIGGEPFGVGSGADGGDVDVCGHGLAVVENDVCFAVGGLFVGGDFGVVFDGHTDFLELLLGFVREAFAEDGEEFVGAGDQGHFCFALQMFAELAGSLDADRTSATDYNFLG